MWANYKLSLRTRRGAEVDALLVFLGFFFLLITSFPPELRQINSQVYVKVLNFLKQKTPFSTNLTFASEQVCSFCLYLKIDSLVRNELVDGEC